MKNLLTTYLPFNYSLEQINESIGRNSGRLIVKGVLQRANSKNQNERVYPRPILEREITRFQENEIKYRRALGELDHPESSIVNLKNVSHNVLAVEWNGDDVVGTIEILNTPAGNILKELFKSGISLGISSRGMGSVKQLDESTTEVQPDFQLVCWDFVSNPSTQGAYMAPVMEGVSKQQPINYLTEAHELITDIICDLSGICCIGKEGKQ